ncbi:MAG: PDZ domain-containing protein, partial [Anaerolineae bacterium]
ESGFSLPRLIQTDAAINPGNSGVGFAVPVNAVKRVVPSLIATGRYADPWLGLTATSVTPLLAEALDLPVQQGVLVQSVVENGPADKFGLLGSDRQVEFEGTLLDAGGDVIVALDGVALQDMDDLIVHLAETRVGQVVTLTVLRDGAERTVEVTLEERPAR